MSDKIQIPKKLYCRDEKAFPTRGKFLKKKEKRLLQQMEQARVHR